MNITKVLKTPFPVPEHFQTKFVISLLFSTFIFLFLIIFQPFGISEIQQSKVSIVSTYSLITFFTVLLGFIIVQKNKDTWNIGKTLINYLCQMVTISLFNWFYSVYFQVEIFSNYSFVVILGITFAVGVIPFALLILLLERFLSKRNEDEASSISKSFTEKVAVDEYKSIAVSATKDIDLNLTDLLCLKSEGNYVKIYEKDGKNFTASLVRASLAKIYSQLEEHDNFKQCHRSFLVNMDQVSKVTGNARNFNLHIECLDFTIPVSRNFPIQSLRSQNQPVTS